MKVSFLNSLKNMGLDDNLLNNAVSNKSFKDYLSHFTSIKTDSIKTDKVSETQKNSMNELKDLMRCQINVNNLAMKVELVSRVAEAGVGSVRKLQNGI
ncbi:MAG: hypothetical protein ACOX3T_03355 [Bdellovibrionota bacterium]